MLLRTSQVYVKFFTVVIFNKFTRITIHPVQKWALIGTHRFTYNRHFIYIYIKLRHYMRKEQISNSVRAQIVPDLCVPMCRVLSHVQLPWPHGLQPTRLVCPRDFPGKNTGVGHHALIKGIFPIQRSNPQLLFLLHYRWILYPLSHQGSLTYNDPTYGFIHFTNGTKAICI